MRSDVCGPAEPAFSKNAKYFTTFIDDFSRFMKMYLFLQKHGEHDRIIEYKTKSKKELGLPVSRLCTNSGGEYVSSNFINFCKKNGIIRRFTASYRPQPSGVAERLSRNSCKNARAPLQFAKVEKCL